MKFITDYTKIIISFRKFKDFIYLLFFFIFFISLNFIYPKKALKLTKRLVDSIRLEKFYSFKIFTRCLEDKELH